MTKPFECGDQSDIVRFANGDAGFAGHAADPAGDESCVLLMPANHRNILAINDPGYF